MNCPICGSTDYGPGPNYDNLRWIGCYKCGYGFKAQQQNKPMTEHDQIKAIAELDGWHETNDAPNYWRNKTGSGCGLEYLPRYLHSRDAIIAVIEKLWNAQNDEDKFGEKFLDYIFAIAPNAGFFTIAFATPAQLREALLKATGKWKE